MKNFSQNFLWGASTSSHQVEGSLINNWVEWENRRILELSKEQLKYGIDNYKSNSKHSCDSFNHYKEDVAILKRLGLKAYRFSIEWSRVEPEKGVFDFNGLEYYKKLVNELKSNGIEPIITLWHWTLPIWLKEEGGVFAKDFEIYFVRMVKQILETISEEVTYWITINEPEVFAMNSYLTGDWPPNEKNVLKFLKFYLFIFPNVHKSTYKVIKKYNHKAMISFAKNSSYVKPYNKNVWNVVIADIFRWFSNCVPVDLVRDYLDYFALNFYFTNYIGIKGLKNKNDDISDLGWWIKPENIEYLIKEIYKKYRLPIMITENGIADSEDSKRSKWIDVTIKALSNCITSGIPIIGYLHWSLLDNFEWAFGFWPKFGLVSVNPDTKERVLKSSAKHYSESIR